MQSTHHWTLQIPLATHSEIQRPVAVCSWRGASSSEAYAGSYRSHETRVPPAVKLQRRDGNLQFHGPRPSMQQVRTPGRKSRSLQQERRLVISMDRHSGSGRLQTARTQREAQIPARRGMDNQGEGQGSRSREFISVLDRAVNTKSTPGRRWVRTSHINHGSVRDGNAGPASLNSRFRTASCRRNNINIQSIQKINIKLLLLLRSLQTAWDCSEPTGMVEFGGVVVLLGTSFCGHLRRRTGKGGNVVCQFEFAGEALVGHHHTEPSSANRTWGQRLCCRSRCSGRVRSVNWPWTLGSGSSAMASPRSQNESALPASDSPVCVTWTSCTRRGISQGRRAG